MTSLRLHLRALALLAATRVLLGRRGTSRTLRRLTTSAGREPTIDPASAMAAIRHTAQIVGGKCLPQAVALAALLQRDGYDPVLVLGCQRTVERDWTAHAWVLLGELKLEPVRANRHEALAYLGAANGWIPSPSERKA